MIKQRNKYIIIISLILVLSLIFTGCGSDDKGTDNKQKAEKTVKPVEIDISFVGDIMAHEPQIRSASSDGGYNFDENFEYVKEYIEASDLAVCNLETTFAGKPYTGYPLFSAPDELADAIKNAGFDVALTSNNHILDKGTDGVKKTVQTLEEKDLPQTGTKADPEDKGYLITTVKGVNIGIVAATYETPMVGGQRTLNGNAMNEEAQQLINSFNYQTIDEDLEEYKQNIEDAKSEGAEIIICFFHWGEEYQKEPNQHQQEIGQKAAEMGADIIFASHPHVLQKEDVITVNEGEASRDVPIFYSMGNFLSNQRLENINNRYAEEGMIAQARITYIKDDKLLKNIETGYIPTWVNKYTSGGKTKYAVIPLIDDYQNNKSLTESGNVSRAERAKSDIEELLGTPNNISKTSKEN